MKKMLYTGSLIVLLAALVFCLSRENAFYADNEVEGILIERTMEIINEKNYFATDESQQFLWGYDVNYDIYSEDNDYFVVLPDDSNIVFAFTKYDSNFYYTGYGEYDNAQKICSGSFCIDDVHKPDYNANDNKRVTRYLDGDTVLSSVISNYNYDEFYTVYLLNSFPWDKSNYLNGSEMVNVMFVDINKNVFVTYCYFGADGWYAGTPGCRFDQEDYMELVEKYKDIAVCSKSAIKNIHGNALKAGTNTGEGIENADGK